MPKVRKGVGVLPMTKAGKHLPMSWLGLQEGGKAATGG